MVKHNPTKLFCGCEDCEPGWLQFLPLSINPFLAINLVNSKSCSTGIGAWLQTNPPTLDNHNQQYYLTQDGHKLTEPMTAGDIVAKFGPIRELEANGFKVILA